MRRRLFNLAAAVSLVLCVAMIALWVRSYWVSELLVRDLEIEGPAYWAVGSRRGSAGIVYFRMPSNSWYEGSRVLKPEWHHHRAEREGIGGGGANWLIPEPRWLSFRATREVDPPDGLDVEVVVPYWFLTAVFLGPATVPYAIRKRRARREQASRCPTCGYDLRASPDRCPECGTAVTRLGGIA